MKPSLKTVSGIETYRIEDNRGVSWDDDVVYNAESLNHLPVKTFKDRVIGQGGVFSDKELKVALELGHIVCDPEPARINSSSIDVRLGENFYLAGDARNVGAIFNPFDEDDVNRYFGKALIAKPAEFVIKKALENLDHIQDLEVLPSGIIERRKASLESLLEHKNLKGIAEDHPIILLRPGERVLGHTDEFIGIKPPGTTSMQSRSTTGRMGVAACFCAGWGDSGYINRWTMEINNLNEHEYVPLPIGLRMAQIVFSTTGPVEIEYSKASGNYQQTDSDHIEDIKSSWQPSSMKPKSFKDVNELTEWRAGMLGRVG